MTSDQLNEKALEAATIAVISDELDYIETMSGAEHVARLAVSAYLAVAQPEGWEQQAKNFMRVIDRLTAENESLKAAEQKAHSDAGWLENMDRQGGA
ncbi:hypothetical protein [Glutamicibacter sp. X7]